MENITIRENYTAGITFQLLNDGVPIDLTSSHHVRLDMLDNLGKTQKYASNDSSPNILITEATSGIVVLYPPTPDTFKSVASPYKMYCWVYTTSSIRYSVPQNAYAQINVLKEY